MAEHPLLGAGTPLSEDGIAGWMSQIGTDDPALFWTIVDVETAGEGFDLERRVIVRFERHVWAKRTHLSPAPTISSSLGTGSSAYVDAYNHDSVAAMMSTSFGLGQVMGFNYSLVGCSTVEGMVAEAKKGEDEQVAHIAAYIRSAGLVEALTSNDWHAFAKGYNGPGYAKNDYHNKLVSAYIRRARQRDAGKLPDLAVRAEQIDLNRTGFGPLDVDGVEGPKTRTAREQAAAAAPPTPVLTPTEREEQVGIRLDAALRLLESVTALVEEARRDLE